MEHFITEIIDNESRMNERDQQLFHTNCAENIFRSACKKYSLDVPERFVQAIIPYGAGMQTQNTCGALLGGIAALGLLYGEEKPTENKKMKAAVSKYVEIYLEKFGEMKCSIVKPAFMDAEGTCTPVKIATGKLLDQVIEHIDEIFEEYLRKEAEEANA